MIMGGRMAPSLAWAPAASSPHSTLSEVEGHGAFVTLHATDAGFQALCGVSLRCNQFLDMLQKARDAAAEEACDVVVDLVFGAGDHNASKRRMLRAKVCSEHACKLQRVLLITLPSGQAVEVKYDLDKRRRVSVKLCADTLTSIVDAATQSDYVGTSTRLKRSREEKVAFLHNEVHLKQRRVYINFRDGDGKMRNHSLSVPKHVKDDEFTAVANELAETLHDYYAENHHPMAGDVADGGESDGGESATDAKEDASVDANAAA